MPVQVIASSSSDGPTLTAAAAASCLPTNVPTVLPAGYWQVGRIWRTIISGRISCVVATPGTARFDIRLGGVIAADTLAIPLNIVAKTSVPFFVELITTCRAAGSGTTTTLLTQGQWLSEAALNVALPATGPGPGGNTLPFNTAPVVGTGFNCQAALTLDCFFTQTVATGSMTVHQFLIEQLTP